MALPLRNLRRNAISDRAIRNIRIHKTERADNGIFPNRYPRHNDAVTTYTATLLQCNRPGFSIDCGNGINGTVGTDLNEILYRHNIFRIDVGKRPDVRLVSQLQSILVLDYPVVLCRFPLFDLWKGPSFKSILGFRRIRGSLGYCAIDVGEALLRVPPSMFHMLLI